MAADLLPFLPVPVAIAEVILKEEALEALEENAQAWLEVLIQNGQLPPEEGREVKIIPASTVTVTL